MSESNLVGLKYIDEDEGGAGTYGTTPANGTWQDLRYVSSSLAANPQTVISNELRSDRMVSDLVKVSEAVGGDVAVELSDGTYDDLLEAGMGGTWTTNVLKAGATKRAYSLELDYDFDGTPHYLQYKGMRVGGFNFNFTYGAIITGGFVFAGKEALSSATSLVGTGSTTAKTTTDVINGSDQVTSITLDGGAITGVTVRSITLNLDNSMRPFEGIGAAGPSNQSYGRSMITGSIETYFDSTDLYDELLAGTAIAIQWVVSDGTNTMTFLMPNVKFNSGTPAVPGVDTDVMLNLEFTALYDSTEDTNLKITRSA